MFMNWTIPKTVAWLPGETSWIRDLEFTVPLLDLLGMGKGLEISSISHGSWL